MKQWSLASGVHFNNKVLMGYSLLGYEHEEDKDWIYLLRMEPFYSIVRRKEKVRKEIYK